MNGKLLSECKAHSLEVALRTRVPREPWRRRVTARLSVMSKQNIKQPSTNILLTEPWGEAAGFEMMLSPPNVLDLNDGVQLFHLRGMA